MSDMLITLGDAQCLCTGACLAGDPSRWQECGLFDEMERFTMYRSSYPLCPKCGLDELWLRRHKYWLDIMCYNCGEIATITPPSSEDELGERIDAMIAEAKHGRANEN